jgi:dihydrofolate reductase
MTLMAMVLWQVVMSLDGFIADSDDAMDWVFQFGGPTEFGGEGTALYQRAVITSTGSVLAGRRSYDVGRRPGQRPEARKVFGGAWSGPQFVLTHQAPQDEEDDTITFLSGDIEEAVATALRAAAGKDVLVIGANVGQQCIDRGLIDEVRVYLVPVMLGEGVRFFGRPGQLINLETVSATQSGQVSTLRFRVAK